MGAETKLRTVLPMVLKASVSLAVTLPCCLVAQEQPEELESLPADNADAIDCDEECQATRQTQDPSAAVNGVFLSNSIGFGPTGDNTLYDFQVQPVATVLQSSRETIIMRGVIPVLGVPTPNAAISGNATDFGLSATVVQAFYVPADQKGVTLFAGPQVSLATHTEDVTQGAGWGGGGVAGAVGFAGPVSYGALVNHLWGQDDFSTTTVQPIVFYNLESPGIGAWFFGYNNSITYDWSVEDGAEEWEIPVGLTVGKTFVLPSKQALALNVGGYSLVETSDGGNDWELTFSANLLF